jgi:hypothetical protein
MEFKTNEYDANLEIKVDYHELDIEQKQQLVSTIDHYIANGFKKICDVQVRIENNDAWFYINVDESLMFSDHSSWVYFIVEDKTIVKVGETSLPLGIKSKTHDQPVSGTFTRFGRLAHWKDATDGRIRQSLQESANNGLVSLWAKQCNTIEVESEVGNSIKKLQATFHKTLELSYMDYMKENFYTPPLNLCRK